MVISGIGIAAGVASGGAMAAIIGAPVAVGVGANAALYAVAAAAGHKRRNKKNK
jgi:hypothetical protein